IGWRNYSNAQRIAAYIPLDAKIRHQYSPPIEGARMIDKISSEGITFDDVLLIPRLSSVVPTEVDTSPNPPRDIRLNIPIVSAAMDTVTESKLAIALAQEGGIGIIHRNLNPADQAREVSRVKRFEAGVIADPVCLAPDETVGTARRLMREQNIGGIPI